MTVLFDTLRLARKLEAAGFSQRQAADTAEAMADAMAATEPVTREHLDSRLRELELRLKHNLTLRLGGIVAAGVAFLAALMKLH
ncbi:MAG: hypothetical protein ABT940_09520 [Alphaproteobacteria bacterium]